ncbi:Pyridoxal phosphate-dependent transferase major region subdomain 2 [Penicillium verrucosum]|uniref:Pyridoxal phosphate-dependent transferase major region subdomain 2 n=1 Tax=Penicillium verrucosum TaxID=60171 RepID=UPI0025458B64|nr:Pyridoxal phosphate-dependent transferase major region subdomain 2 [Penicillium verrucosum]KAJ5920093.1 Pyridoxal phosphate-dependent transferase major region subdomain 2 [Penicillium verrucosum]
MGIECRFIKSEDPRAYADAVDVRTKFIWIETISNPGNVIPDFKGLAKVVQERGLPLICDNTFGCAGYFCRPIDHGVDIVVHSATKWISGHGTTIGGIIVDGGTFDWGRYRNRFPQFHASDTRLWRSSAGGRSRCGQLLIGLESLAVRCQRHAENTQRLADWLRSNSQKA